jgi:cytochrome P450
LIGSAVEELLRFDGPIEVPLRRFAYEDVQISGVKISHGDTVYPVLLAANRDPEVFPNPNMLDITREPNKHIAFGNGIHFCLGAPLARVEAAIAINTLLARLPDLHIAPDAVENIQWMDTLLIHGMKAFPVKF